METFSPLVVVTYVLVVFALDCYYLSKHQLIFLNLTKNKNKFVRYFLTAFSALLSFSLFFLPMAIYHFFFQFTDYPKALIYGLGITAYILAAGLVAYLKKKGKI